MTTPTPLDVDALWEGYCQAARPIGDDCDLELFDIEDMNDAAHDLYTRAKSLTADLARVTQERDAIQHTYGEIKKLCEQWAERVTKAEAERDALRAQVQAAEHGTINGKYVYIDPAPISVQDAAWVLLANMGSIEAVTGGIFAVQMEVALRALTEGSET